MTPALKTRPELPVKGVIRRIPKIFSIVRGSVLKYGGLGLGGKLQVLSGVPLLAR